jgi:hypothetical protein
MDPLKVKQLPETGKNTELFLPGWKNLPNKNSFQKFPGLT